MESIGAIMELVDSGMDSVGSVMKSVAIGSVMELVDSDMESVGSAMESELSFRNDPKRAQKNTTTNSGVHLLVLLFQNRTFEQY